jgi:hypothetical protein
LLIRLFAGGIVVSAFSLLADVLRPKSFAGLFGAAPSVALVSLSLAIPTQGPGYVATEGRSMMIGAAALCAFGVALVHLLMKARLSALMRVSYPLPSGLSSRSRFSEFAEWSS